MKRLLFTLTLIYFSLTGMAQLQFNEFYVEPNRVPGYRHEFFELRNPVSNGGDNTDKYILVTFFERDKGNNTVERGFYVLDLPDITVAPGQLFLGTAADPYQYQDLDNTKPPIDHMNSDYNWNAGATAMKYTYTSSIAPYYTASPLATDPANFIDWNDIFSKNKSGNDYVMFLFKDGVLNGSGYGDRVDGFIGGSNSLNLPTYITGLPPIKIAYTVGGNPKNMTIDPSNVTHFVNSVPSVSGTDNGYYANCAGNWLKSSAPKEHTPGDPNFEKKNIDDVLGALNIVATGLCVDDNDPALDKIVFDVFMNTHDDGFGNQVPFVPDPADFPLQLDVYWDKDCGGASNAEDVDPGEPVVESITLTYADFIAAIGVDYTGFYTFEVLLTNFSNPPPTGAVCYIVSMNPTNRCRRGEFTRGECAFVTLPVTFTSFEADRHGSNVMLKWETATEINNKGFYLQRKVGNGDWASVTFINSHAPNGNSTTNMTYVFTDANPTKSISQYRLLQVDYDGKQKYSEVRSVKGLEQNGQIVIYPIPSKDGIVNVIFEDADALRNVIVSDMVGRVINQWKGTGSSMQIQNLRPGQYNIMIMNTKTGINEVRKALVTH